MQGLNVSIANMPAVIEILETAQKQIFKLTGVDAKVEIYNEQRELPPKKQLLQGMLMREFDLSWNEIISKSRKTEIVKARFFYSWIAVKILKYTTVLTGRELQKDHSTVINALQEVKQSKENLTELWRDLDYFIKHFCIESEKIIPNQN